MKNGWGIRNLGDLCEVVGGGTPPKDTPAYYSGKIPWATVRDMRQDVITETECRITKEAVQRSATNIIPSGNVVIATRVGLGKVCMLAQDTAINQDLRGIIPRDTTTLSVRFLFWWLKSIADVIVAEGTGATVQGVKLPFVKSLQIPAPRFPNSGASSAFSTKRLRASPPPKPTSKRTSKTPAPSSKATSNPSSPNARLGGWRSPFQLCAISSMASHLMVQSSQTMSLRAIR
jgi:hypothetical protein